MLEVQRLDARAKLPTCAHPEEDLAYDLYALEDAWVFPFFPKKLRTGVAARFLLHDWMVNFGLLIRDRSSMASKGFFVTGGVVDAGYTGEIRVLLSLVGFLPKKIYAGDKIAQMIPLEILTGAEVLEVQSLNTSSRGANGFGSSGR